MDFPRSLLLPFPDEPAQPAPEQTEKPEKTGEREREETVTAAPVRPTEPLEAVLVREAEPAIPAPILPSTPQAQTPPALPQARPSETAPSDRAASDPATEALARGALVVTANQRTARTLRQRFEEQQRTAGRTFWQPPTVLAWDGWTTALWRQLLVAGRATKLLLTSPQEHQVWRAVIASDTEWSSLETVDALADLAADAWRRVSAHRAHAQLHAASSHDGTHNGTEDTRAFLRWAQTFQRRCQSHGYLPQSRLEETLLEALEAGELPLEADELLLVGFDAMTPAQTALLDGLRANGIPIEFWMPAVPERNDGLNIYAAEDPDAELRAAARWIRQLLDTAAGGTVTDGRTEPPRIAVILPSVEPERAAIDRIFREILSPELLPITAGAAPSPYEFSLGQPLARVPMVATALELLRWPLRPLALESVSRLLLAPSFLASVEERGARAEFDAFELRRATLLRPELSLNTLIDRLERSRRASRLGGLLRQLRSLRRAATDLLATNLVATNIGEGEPHRTYAEWGDAINDLLRAASWANAGSEDSIAFQTRRKWESSLDQLATLDFEGTRPTYREALDALETLLEDTLFAPESRQAPVQILGPLEAGGTLFDAVWFLRAGELDWPARPKPNPLLGWPLQRALRMPGADVAADREHAQRITQRIAASAPTVIFSYARATADSHQRPSTLLNALALTPLLLANEEEEGVAIALEAVADDARIPLANPQVRGGASVLKSQAACGFRAFAERRLWSTELETTVPGMDARERGDLVHVTLQRLWDELRTQDTLRSLSSEDRTAAIDRAITQALTHTPGVNAWETAYVEVQRQRLHRLLTPWIEHELARQLPFTVKLREEAMEVGIGPLRLKLRIDRVDETDAGDVLIDYKTGSASHKDWLSERPDEPQLPLYAMMAESQLAAIAFARIRPGDQMGLDGYAAQEGILPKPAPLHFESLEEQVAEWRRILTQLAEDFHAGDARVAPKSYPKTCQHCAQRLLCRLNPATLGDLDDHADHHDGENAVEAYV